MTTNGTSDELTHLQHWMQASLVAPANGAATVNEYITPSATLNPAQRLAIYQRSYYGRLVQCMQGQFKALCYGLGQELFSDFAREYLLQHPSHSPTLAHLGNHFADFLQNTRPDRNDAEQEAWIDFMVDLARFEWDLYQVFDAPGQEEKGYADAHVPESQLQLQACLYLFQYRFAVSNYYIAVARGEEPQVSPRMDSYVAICRKNFRTGIFNLPAPQFTFLSHLKQGISIDEALARTAEVHQKTLEQTRTGWEQWKANWLQAGFFAAL